MPQAVASRRSKTSALFDHLVGGGEQRWWHGEAQHPCRRVIDDEFELDSLHDWQVGRFCTLEDATGIDTDLTIRIRQAGSVAHQAADFGIFTRPIGGRDCMARRQEDQLNTSADKKGAAADENRVGSLTHKCREGRIEVPAGTDVENSGCAVPWRAQPFPRLSIRVPAFASVGSTSTAT